MLRFVSRLVAFWALILILLAVPTVALAQDNVAGSLLGRLTLDRKALDEISSALAAVKDSDDLAKQRLQRLLPQIEQARADLADLVTRITPDRDASNVRLKKLGAAPGPNAPAEPKDAADARATEQFLNTRLNDVVNGAQEQITRAKGLADSIAQRQKAVPSAPLAQDNSAGDFEKALADITAGLDQVQSGIKAVDVKDDTSSQTLQKLRAQIEEARTALVTLQTNVTPVRDASKKRLDALGAAPKAGDPPEAPDIAAARKKEEALSGVSGKLNAVLTGAQYQVARATDLANAITELQREVITGRLFSAGEGGIFSAGLWANVVDNLPKALSAGSYAVSTSTIYFWTQINSTSIAIFLLTIAGGYVVAQFLRYRIIRWRSRLPRAKKSSRRYVASLDAVLGVVHAMLGLPTAVCVAVLAFHLADLLPSYVIEDFGWDFIRAVLLGTALWALARAILAAEHPDLRLVPLSDWAVRRIYRRMNLFAVVFGVSVLLDGIIKSLHADIALTIARDCISACLYLLVIASLLIRIRSAPPTVVDGQPVPPDEDITRLDILRPISWVAVLVMIVSLLFGYMALAVAAAILPLMVISIVVASYLLMTLVDSALTDNLLSDLDRRRAIANAVGVTSKNVAFSATLLSGLLRLFVLFLAVLALGAPFGFYSADMVPALQRAYFGFQLGEMTISPSSILGGIALFTGIWAVTRLVRGWMSNTLLPRTSLDAGLQNSIATIVGYIGIILAISASLSEIGLSLQNIAYVASALAVGIGFGLQAIVNNFVSGLILLAERPIRVGDIIAASGEEGYVRRISVRATEIETFDRATLIVPNSLLITSTVKNWVYGNTWSRLRIALSLGYDSDVDVVRTAMLGAAEDDPRILPSPAPRVFLANMSNTALEFELIVMVASMETLPAVKSDLLLRILKVFRAKGIRVVAQLPALPPPVVVSLDEALGAVAAAKLRGEERESRAPKTTAPTSTAPTSTAPSKTAPPTTAPTSGSRI